MWIAKVSGYAALIGFLGSFLASCWMWTIGQPFERQVLSINLTLSTSLGVDLGPQAGSPSTRPCCRSTTRRMGGPWDSVVILVAGDGEAEFRCGGAESLKAYRKWGNITPQCPWITEQGRIQIRRYRDCGAIAVRF